MIFCRRQYWDLNQDLNQDVFIIDLCHFRYYHIVLFFFFFSVRFLRPKTITVTDANIANLLLNQFCEGMPNVDPHPDVQFNMYIYIYMYMYIYICVYVYIYMYICVYIYIHIYIYVAVY